MSTAVQRRRGTTAEHSTRALLNGELSIDTDKKVVVVHDGSTLGGFPAARADSVFVTGLPTDGTTDVLAKLNAAQAANDYLRIPPGRYFLSAPWSPADGKRWSLEGVEFVHGNDTQAMISAIGRKGFSITGKWALTGLRTAAQTGTEVGLLLDSCSDYIVEGGTLSKFKGSGLKIVGTTAQTFHGNGGRLSNLWATGNNKGYELLAGSGGEYLNWSNASANGNDTGVWMASGNHNWMGGNITDNTIGVDLQPGANHLHGNFTGTLINHNTTLVKATDLTLGHRFNNCNFYAGNIQLNNSKDIIFLGGNMDCTYESNGAAGFNHVIGAHYPSATLPVITGDNKGKLQFSRNTGNIGRDLNGPSPHYTQVYRTSTLQTIPASTTTDLIFPLALMNRNNDYNLANGVWTCPVSGRYRFIVEALVGGTGLDATASYISVRSNTGSGYADTMLILPDIFSNTRMRFASTFDVGYDAGGMVKFTLNLNAAGTFGDSVWLSLLSIEKVS